MLFDTDVLIWVQKGNPQAASLIDRTLKRHISIQTYMELLQCAQNKVQQKYIRDFLSDFNFITLLSRRPSDNWHLNISNNIHYRPHSEPGTPLLLLRLPKIGWFFARLTANISKLSET